MSGGSGGGGFVTRKKARSESDGGAEDRCNITVQVPLSATDPTNLKKISVGDELAVELRNSRGIDSVVALAPTDQSYVGTIAYADVDELIDCINEGFEYQAKVLHLSPTSAKVLVHRK